LAGPDRRERQSFVGGSDANVILSGDRNRILALWREKRGEAEPQDLTGSLSVMLGCWTEPFNRQWYERLSGEQVGRVGQSVTCPKYDWRRCTVDGFVERSGAVWEAKHTSAFAKPEELLERYGPQLQHNMAVVGCDLAVLSVIFGNHKFEIIDVAADWLYQLELLEAEEEFWDCVLTGKEPVPIEPPPPPKPFAIREVCLDGNNAWASAAFDWLKHREAAKVHASATALIKSLIEEDVSRAFGHGIEAKRSKSGAITIREFGL
jgi:predicted phage-related endonuclease